MSTSKYFVFFFFLLFVFSSFSLSAASSHSHPASWQAFLNLTDCRHGDAHPVLPELKKYLRRFGYLSADSSNFGTDTFGDDLEAALITYQQNFNLNVTGVLDRSTIAQLMKPRCGVPDIVNGSTSMSSGKFSGRGLYAYFNGEPKWPSDKRQLTYALTTTSAVPIDPSVLNSLFSSAFSRWSAVTDFRFTEVSSGSDITIGFYNGDHGDGNAFDGPNGILAHAFPPTDGKFHLDAAEDWVAQGDVTRSSSPRAIDMESVAVHEIGHLLGMAHSSVEEAIMYPSIAPKTRKVELADDDKEGIQNLYGNNN